MEQAMSAWPIRTSRRALDVRPLVRSLVRSLVRGAALAFAAPRSALLGSALLGSALAGSALPLAAQVVEGRVGAARGPIAGAEVRLSAVDADVSGSPATATDPDGRFRLRAGAPGEWVLEVSMLGYRRAERRLELDRGDTVRVEIVLEVEALTLDPLVVTGTLSETRVSESAVKVDVVSARMLQRNASASLMDAIGHVNGLYQQVDCGICYTNSLRINGMEGPYTAVLIDGMPIMGALASVYGLNGIDPALVQQLEILKGPQSTLHGPEAMGGVVNVITKDPRFAPRYAVDASRSDLGESTLRLGLAPTTGAVATLLSGTLVHNDRFFDENGDGFSDLSLDTRLALFGKATVHHEGRELLAVAGKLYHEDRFGGVEAWTPAHRGSAEVYGESILTDRVELMAQGRVPGTQLRAGLSWAGHRQRSWYGDTGFRAEQDVGFARLLWDPPRSGRHDPIVGVTARLTRYDDDTPATTEAERRLVPGVFAEDALHLGGAWIVLGGLRVDRHAHHGVIASPRASVRFQPTEGTTFRVNFGTGFRVVSVFTEDHAALTGARDVVIAEDLEPERSWSLALNANQVLEWGRNPMMIDLDVFHARFSNRIVPDYDTDPDQIRYGNLEGHAVSRGVSLSLNQSFAELPFLYQVGITLQDVWLQLDGLREPEVFAPTWKGVWTLSWTPRPPLTLDWTGSAVGPMRLPRYPEPHQRPTRSGAWQAHNLQATVRLAQGREIYLAAKNLTGFRQGSPLIAPGDPYGDAFDTNYVWGPIVGRRLVAGVRLAGSR
jgi:outer membrane receptor for ferrienterochelin and colicins